MIQESFRLKSIVIADGQQSSGVPHSTSARDPERPISVTLLVLYFVLRTLT
jgi:hypothetical protein